MKTFVSVGARPAPVMPVSVSTTIPAGGTLVFVSHEAAVVERLCERAILLDKGRVVEQGPAHDVLHAYHRRLADEPAVAIARLPADQQGGAIRKAAGH